MNLLRSVEKYMTARRIPASRFGREATGDPRFVFDLRRGREPRPATVARIKAYMQKGSQPCAH